MSSPQSKLARIVLTCAAMMMTPVAHAEPIDNVTPLVSLRSLDERVMTIGHRLAVANADLCPDRSIATGIVLHSLSQYGPAFRPAAVQAFGLGQNPSVLAVAAGSKAARAGLRHDDKIVRIDGSLLPLDSLGDEGSFTPTERATEIVEQALGDGRAVVEIDRNGTPARIVLEAEEGCPSRFQVIPARPFSGKADGHYVQLTSNLVVRVDDDAELAAVLAHELAHNVLEHRVRLNEANVQRGFLRYFGKNASRIRQTEIEADRLSVYLLDRAGYDPNAAEGFWRRFGPQHPWGPFGTPTHPSWRDRAETLKAETESLLMRKANEARPLPDFMQEDATAPAARP